MNIWEHQALAAAGKLVADALPVAKKVGAKGVEALVHGAERTASQVEKDIAAHAAAHAQSNPAEGFMEKALHSVEHALHLGSQEAQTAQPQAEASAAQAPVAAPQDAQAPAVAPEGAEERKAALLAELHDLESKVENLGG